MHVFVKTHCLFIDIRTWQCRMMVHIRPRMMEGFPSMMSGMFMFTSLIWENINSCLCHLYINLNVQTDGKSSSVMWESQKPSYRFILQEVQSRLDVASLLKHTMTPLALLQRNKQTPLYANRDCIQNISMIRCK